MSSSPPPSTPIGAAASLVALPTAGFWAIKVLTTGVGETSSDYLVRTFDPPVVVLATAALVAVAAVIQFTARRYTPWRYWTLVLGVGVFGTMAADVAHVVLTVPYLVSTAFFAVTTGAVLFAWKRVEGTVDVHSVTTLLRQVFYWLMVGSTFALGTAAGDLTAVALRLGFGLSAVLFCGGILAAAVLWRVSRRGAVMLFWTAYVLTRPFGASVADGLAVDPARGGLGWGTGPVSLAGLLLIVVGVVALHLFAERPSPSGSGALAPSEERSAT